MFIYKFTHIPSGKCYIGQTIKEVNKRTSGGKTWNTFTINNFPSFTSGHPEVKLGKLLMVNVFG